jgi:hypothetical protein
VVSSAESVSQLLGQAARTLVLVETENLGRRVAVGREVVELLDARCPRAALDVEAGLVAWTCEGKVAAVPPAAAPMANRQGTTN